MRVFYTTGIFLYGFFVRCASLFNPKAKQWIRGRKQLFADLEKKRPEQKTAWFHCASLGEFEQGRPLIEKFKSQYPGYRIVLTFFSPSGFEVRKNYPGADLICYLPLDTPGNAERFIEIINPSVVFFIKYEFWLNHLAVLRRKKIPHFLVSAIFREDQVFFKSHGSAFREALRGFAHVFTQEENSIRLLDRIGIKQAGVSGDTRFDRVKEIASGAKEIPVAASFAGAEKKVIVAGSTWPEDEALLFPVLKNHLNSGWKLLIAPHELSESHLDEIEKKLSDSGVRKDEIRRFSKSSSLAAAGAKVLLIDNMGMLSSLYRYGRIAYIGGGFGKSIHNTLEAAVYGIPVVFGPRFEKFNEAKELIACKGGFHVSSGEELKNRLDELLGSEELLTAAGRSAGNYVSAHTGATEKVLAVATGFLNR
jgi:3-deoxy-D-manno-octulosonic-acid transferase